MRTIISTVLIAIFFSCNKKPRINIVNNKLQLDTIYCNSTKSGNLVIENRGNADLIISDFQCSCECTIPDLAKNTRISSDGSMVLKINVKSFQEDTGQWKLVHCTLKSNSENVFNDISIKYYTK